MTEYKSVKEHWVDYPLLYLAVIIAGGQEPVQITPE